MKKGDALLKSCLGDLHPFFSKISTLIFVGLLGVNAVRTRQELTSSKLLSKDGFVVPTALSVPLFSCNV